MKVFRAHCLFIEEDNEKILSVCKPFFEWIKEESDDESDDEESEEESQEDD